MKTNQLVKYLFQALDCKNKTELTFRDQRKQYIKMNNKRRNFILMRIIDHPDAIVCINKFLAEIKKEENIQFEQVLYILMRSLLIH